MKVRGINDYDIVNFKVPSLFIAFPYCSFKCDKDCGEPICQNSALVNEPIIDVSIKYICELYDKNPLTRAVVCGGLEPFDSFDDLQEFINAFRIAHNDIIIIYTGYRALEIHSKVQQIQNYGNIIIKYGRYKPNTPSRYDDILGITLASENQYTVYYE